MGVVAQLAESTRSSIVDVVSVPSAALLKVPLPFQVTGGESVPNESDVPLYVPV
jgi:hypothetical protein